MPSPVDINGRMARYDSHVQRWAWLDTGELLPEAEEAAFFALTAEERAAQVAEPVEDDAEEREPGPARRGRRNA